MPVFLFSRKYSDIWLPTANIKSYLTPKVDPILNIVVVFTLNRSFHLTTSAVPPVSFLILHPRYKFCGHRQWDREKPNAKESRQANQVLAYNKKKRHPRNRSYEKKNTRGVKKNIRIPRWGRVQMTQQAERTRTIKYVLAESSRWLLHRRRDTRINIPGCREKKKEKKRKRKTKSRKQGTKASKHENRTQGWNKVISR